MAHEQFDRDEAHREEIERGARLLARIIHDGSSSPTHPSPYYGEGGGRGRETGARSREGGKHT